MPDIKSPVRPTAQVPKSGMPLYKPPYARGKSSVPLGRIIAVLAVVLAISLLLMLGLVAALMHRNNSAAAAKESLEADIEMQKQLLAIASAKEMEVLPIAEPKISFAKYTAQSKTITGIDSTYAILIDINKNEVVASLDGEEKMYPASMTKVMTLIVAVEHIADLNELYTFNYGIINPVSNAGASVAGFSVGESVPLVDLLYGAALPSGADATAALADYVAASEEVFAGLMNEKAEEMGLHNTHFMNASGLHDENHYSTAHEMALIFEYAMQIPVLEKVLSTYQYTTTPTEQHPEGLLLQSTTFSRMRGDEPDIAEVIAGKTGYTLEGKNCLVSYAVTKDGRAFVLVTAFATGKYAPIYDAIDIYNHYIPDVSKN